MSGSKVYVKKPLRRYERDFNSESAEEPAIDSSEEISATPNPDITSPSVYSGPAMHARKTPVRYRTPLTQVAKKGKEKKKPENDTD